MRDNNFGLMIETGKVSLGVILWVIFIHRERPLIFIFFLAFLAFFLKELL